MMLVVVDGGFAGAEILEVVALYHQGRVFIDTYSQDLGMSVTDIDQFCVAFSLGQVWIDRYVPEESESSLMSGSHEQWFIRATTHDKRTLNDGTGGCAVDHPSAVKQGAQLFLSARVEVSVGESAGIPSAKKDSGCGTERLTNSSESAMARSRV